MEQPGYDALADLYDRTFPDPYLTALERHAVAAFADHVLDGDVGGVVLDVGCGVGHVTADLAERGLEVIGVDPSREMLGFARRHHPDLRFVHDDARLGSVDLEGRGIAGILARFSLIHVPPTQIPDVLAGWADRMAPGSVVAVAGQGTDEVGRVLEFDHRVTPAWRWHPDRMSAALADAGFDELWRTVSRPFDELHRFPEFHVVARRG
ncbi:class I SAM-dependent methyltransferase [Rhodococcus yananensis]|uniref:class I SAM-dependent methyltransferase n=1 Tax=Rhodococcus yananensis TaxID=2879464 RepID=UPI001CF8697B|nr:class I SAM-dependent methyltransferase [Rhodococcus yananensis]